MFAGQKELNTDKTLIKFTFHYNDFWLHDQFRKLSFFITNFFW